MSISPFCEQRQQYENAKCINLQLANLCQPSKTLATPLQHVYKCKNRIQHKNRNRTTTPRSAIQVQDEQSGIVSCDALNADAARPAG